MTSKDEELRHAAEYIIGWLRNDNAKRHAEPITLLTKALRTTQPSEGEVVERCATYEGA